MLSKERIAELKMYFTRCVQSRSLSTVVHLAECGLELIEMVEALQQENERLNAALDKAVDMIGDNSRCPTDYRLRKCSDYETCLHCWKDWFLGGKNDV